jgi:hypothetical protein
MTFGTGTDNALRRRIRDEPWPPWQHIVTTHCLTTHCPLAPWQHTTPWRRIGISKQDWQWVPCEPQGQLTINNFQLWCFLSRTSWQGGCFHRYAGCHGTCFKFCASAGGWPGIAAAICLCETNSVTVWLHCRASTSRSLCSFFSLMTSEQLRDLSFIGCKSSSISYS